MENDPITALVMKSLRNCMHQEGRNGGEKPWLQNQTLVMRMTEILIEVHWDRKAKGKGKADHKGKLLLN